MEKVTGRTSPGWQGGEKASSLVTSWQDHDLGQTSSWQRVETSTEQEQDCHQHHRQDRHLPPLDERAKYEVGILNYATLVHYTTPEIGWSWFLWWDDDGDSCLPSQWCKQQPSTHSIACALTWDFETPRSGIDSYWTSGQHMPQLSPSPSPSTAECTLGCPLKPKMLSWNFIICPELF